MEFVRLSLTYGVPIVPVVSAGGHETMVTLTSFLNLARWTGLSRVARVNTVPVQIGIPWGIWFSGFLPHVPLPATISYALGEPIEVPHAPHLANDRQLARRYYDRTERTMQAMIDELARRPRFPIVG